LNVEEEGDKHSVITNELLQKFDEIHGQQNHYTEPNPVEEGEERNEDQEPAQSV